MNVSKLALVAVAFAGTLAATAADAHGRDDVQLSVTIGAPFVAPVRPVVVAPPFFVPAPVVRYERGYERYDGRYDARASYRAPRRSDGDGDGIPNRHDRFDDRKHIWR